MYRDGFCRDLSRCSLSGFVGVPRPEAGATKLAPSELASREREIAAIDAEIHELVYELYAITDQERKTIEGA
jgi:hypothetical protein